MDEESCARWIKFAAALLLATSLLTGCRKEWGSTTGIGGATALAAEARCEATGRESQQALAALTAI